MNNNIHTAEKVKGYDGMTLVGSSGIEIKISRNEDGTWTVGKQTFKTEQGVANQLNLFHVPHAGLHRCTRVV